MGNRLAFKSNPESNLWPGASGFLICWGLLGRGHLVKDRYTVNKLLMPLIALCGLLCIGFPLRIVFRCLEMKLVFTYFMLSENLLSRSGNVQVTPPRACKSHLTRTFCYYFDLDWYQSLLVYHLPGPNFLSYAFPFVYAFLCTTEKRRHNLERII